MIHFTILNSLIHFGDVDKRYAAIPAILISASYVFLMNRNFTFRSRNDQRKEAFKFAMVYGPAIVFNYAFYRLFLYILEPYEGILPFLSTYNYATALAIAIVAVWNYTLSHFFVFKRKPEEEEKERYL